MTRHDNRNIQARKAAAPSRIPAARLDALIEEAIVDAYTGQPARDSNFADLRQHLENAGVGPALCCQSVSTRKGVA